MTCIYEYHRNYNERFGVSEVQRVASRMRYTYGAPPPLGEVKHTPTAAIDAALDTELKRRSEQSARRRTALEGLLDGTLQFYGQALTATVHPERPESKGVPKLKIAPGDLASLARLYGFLASVGDDGQVTASRGQALVESVRIRSARAAGADIVQAAVEDVEELRVVLHHMQLAATAAEAVGVDDDGFGGGAAEGEG